VRFEGGLDGFGRGKLGKERRMNERGCERKR
jgi:hypothetical protein